MTIALVISANGSQFLAFAEIANAIVDISKWH